MSACDQKQIFSNGESGVHSFRIPALTTTKDGILIAVCDARVERGGDAPNNIDLVMRRSLDNGETWTPIEVVARFPGDEAACDPCILSDRETGAIWVFYDHAVPHGTLPRGRKMMFHAIQSGDGGAAWSAPRDMTSQVVEPGWHYLSVAPGRGLQTRAGTPMTPVYSVRKDDTRACHLLCSEDHGDTWELRAGVGEAVGEPQAVELDDGSIMMNIRQRKEHGRRKIAISKDGGRSWAKVWEDDALIDPGCQASLLKCDHPDSEKPPLIFSNAACATERRNMTVRLSHDEGQTWPASRLVNEGRSMYSCLTVLADGRVGLLYENGEGLVFARLTLDWIERGRTG